MFLVFNWNLRSYYKNIFFFLLMAWHLCLCSLEQKPNIQMADKFLSLIEQRRTYYNLKAESPISDKQIVEIATRILLHSPSSFNCQSTRLVILLHSNHVRFWQIAQDCFRILLPAAEYAEYEKKLKGRQAGYGTVSHYFTSCLAITDIEHTDSSLRRLWSSP